MKLRIPVCILFSVLLLLCGCQPTDAPQNDPALKEPMFRASVTDTADELLTVIPLQGEQEHTSGNSRISFSLQGLDTLSIQPGDVIAVAYDGNIMETYPAQIRATAVSKVNERVAVPFEDEWLDKATADYYEDQTDTDFVISAIYDNCFFAQSVTPMPYLYKINGSLGDEWCVGDQVSVTHRNNYYSRDRRVEMDLVSVEISTYVPDPYTCAKPVIYLYPEEDTALDVTLTLNGELTCTYPVYRSGWHVTASPDGTLTDASGQTYNYLYWEGDTNTVWDRSEGFCIKGEDTAAFLETALADLGLTRREANEFIVYWLPLMEQHPYNLIAFQTDAYTDAAKLSISPAPDTFIRVFMTFTASDTFTDIPAQTLTAPDRIGFTAVEWGGTELK